MTLSDHLRLRRKELGLSQREVARAIGGREMTTAGWEHGTQPYKKSWPKIIAFLGYDPREALEREAAD